MATAADGLTASERMIRAVEISQALVGASLAGVRQWDILVPIACDEQRSTLAQAMVQLAEWAAGRYSNLEDFSEEVLRDSIGLNNRCPAGHLLLEDGTHRYPEEDDHPA